ncbi:hypothetical protein DSUL_80080 [Desulfovibrionales bacterium]
MLIFKNWYLNFIATAHFSSNIEFNIDSCILYWNISAYNYSINLQIYISHSSVGSLSWLSY